MANLQLMSGEELLWSGRPSWRNMISMYVRGAAIAVAVLIVAWLISAVGGGGLLVASAAGVAVLILVITFVWAWIVRLGISYAVTSRRIVVKRGILSRDERSAQIDRVQNINIHQSPMQRMLQVGNVEFETAGNDEADLIFVGVDEPDSLRHRIDALYEERRGGHSEQSGL